MIQGSTIQDIPIGLKVSFSKTVGESDVYLFAGITGDLDPNHVDEEYSKTTPFGHVEMPQASLLPKSNSP